MSDKYVYHLDECTLALPPGFVDRSTHVLEWKAPSGGKLALVVQREAADGAPLEAVVSKQLRTYASQLLAYRPDRSFSEDFHGTVVMHHTFRWKAEAFPIYQHQAFLLDGGVVVAFTVTGRVEDAAAVDELMESTIEGLRFRD